ncbi:mitotic-spindle organizing protein 1 [Peziza echinospora]|nr:mitotic-spindle organizing protein 1 [Peziza echinospora]
MSEARSVGKHQAAREAVDILLEIATLLVCPPLSPPTSPHLTNTQLDRTSLPLCVHLIENGVNPEALASIIKELRRETEELRAGDGTGTEVDAEGDVITDAVGS